MQHVREAAQGGDAVFLNTASLGGDTARLGCALLDGEPLMLLPCAPDDDGNPRSDPLRCPRNHVPPSLIHFVGEREHVAVPLRDLDLVPALRLLHENELAGVAEGDSDSDVDGVIPLVILIRMEVAPIFAVAIKVRERPYDADIKMFRQALDNSPICGCTREKFVRPETNRAVEFHACVEPTWTEAQFLHQALEHRAIFRVPQKTWVIERMARQFPHVRALRC
mmetsp:Transcript_105904/g.297777  ORF Transcript_105904/g.297777 Transcript_105904/m.297777 type:complete len:223 (+) Transcript_105904:414-1082(+)